MSSGDKAMAIMVTAALLVMFFACWLSYDAHKYELENKRLEISCTKHG